MSPRLLIEYRKGHSPDALANLPDGCAACVLTDPPYGTETKSSLYGRRQASGGRRTIANDVGLGELAACAPLALRVLAADGVALVFMAPTMFRAACDVLEGAGFRVWHSLPWYKGNPGISYRTRFAYEDCILATHPDADPWPERSVIIAPIKHPRNNILTRSPEHPNDKPVGMLRKYLAWACPTGGLVVDPFAGIASSGIAAHAERCDWIGAEMDPQWWPIAERRIAEVRSRPHADLEATLFDTGCTSE